MNVATGGFGTEVTVKTDPKMKQQLGGAAYIITGQFLGTVFSLDNDRIGNQENCPDIGLSLPRNTVAVKMQ